MDFSAPHLQEILDRISDLKEILKDEENLFNKELRKADEQNSASAKNLLHYRALRTVDLTEFQNALGFMGLSRLARAQQHVYGSIHCIEYIIRRLLGETMEAPIDPDLSIKKGIETLRLNTTSLLGPPMFNRRVRIMVTLPSDAADNYQVVRNIVKNGANCVRINCAHDNENSWLKMIENVKRAESEFGRSVRIAMDLAGPKIRTGGIQHTFKLKDGDSLFVHKEDPIENETSKGYHISCGSKELFKAIQPGEPVLFDDGKISGIVEDKDENHFQIKIKGQPEGKKLKQDKGINVPDTALKLGGLTEKDKKDLAFVVKHADLVNISFVNTPKDVKAVIKQLRELDVKEGFGLVLKIETKKAFVNLTELLLAAMRWHPFGIMIARGDLAVETGWTNMAVLQVEILNICSAAHAPVIWATQVLESLAKRGVPSRSEITDAAASLKAECVMLNKGPYILDAIRALDKILTDMELYQSKSSSLSPKLAIETNLI
ncbi:MAG: pyruvate kinase [Bacteroidota bacterium]